LSPPSVWLIGTSNSTVRQKFRLVPSLVHSLLILLACDPGEYPTLSSTWSMSPDAD
jgi:hypothetical protein